LPIPAKREKNQAPISKPQKMATKSASGKIALPVNQISLFD
jgi:hypothetical protein